MLVGIWQCAVDSSHRLEDVWICGLQRRRGGFLHSTARLERGSRVHMTWTFTLEVNAACFLVAQY